MKKIIATMLALAAMVSTVAFAGCVEENAASVPAVEESFVVTTESNVGIALASETIPVGEYATYGIAKTVESVKKLTARLLPENASDKRVDFSAQWVNAGSTWATGKTVSDYVEITQEKDGALTALITCKQAFGEQIKVTVTARSAKSVQATCLIDYSQKLDGIRIDKMIHSWFDEESHFADGSIVCQDGGAVWYWDSYYEDTTDSNAEVDYLDLTPFSTSAYTIGDVFNSFQVSFKATDAYNAALSVLGYNTYNVDVSSTNSTIYPQDRPIWSANYFPVTCVNLGDASASDVVEDCYTALNTLGDEPFMEISITGKGRHSDFSEVFYVTADFQTYAEASWDETRAYGL